MDTCLRTTAWQAPRSAAELLLPAVGTSLAVSLILAGGTLLLRRVSGAAAMPLHGWLLLVSSGVLAAAAWIVRWTWLGSRWIAGRPQEAGSHSHRTWAVHAAAGVASGLMLLAISTPASGMVALAGAWLVWLASEAAAWCFGLAAWPQGDGVGDPRNLAMLPAGSGERQAPADAGALCDTPATGPRPRSHQEDDDLVASNLVQQITRMEDAEGERVHALARVAIEAGDCLGVLHLAFGPPLVGHPHLAACVVDEPQATARVTDAETFGARVEVRLPQPAPQSRSVWVEVHGLAPSPSSRAGSQTST